MAHADYSCCAICDQAMSRETDADAKDDLCARCAVRLSMAVGKEIISVPELLAWMHDDPKSVAVLQSLGFSICHYDNPVDAGFKDLEGKQ